MALQYQNVLSSKGNRIDDLLVLKPDIFGDTRGFFFESWNQKDWINILTSNNQKKVAFVQDNHSKSCKGVLRGLHFQNEPFPQGKLVRCISGEIFDVAVDLRINSKTFCEWSGIYLTDKNKNQFWIPEGFAHGFLTISDYAEVLYKTTNYWSKECEESIIWNDPDINIEWPLDKIQHDIKLSEKDNNAKTISEFIKKNIV